VETTVEIKKGMKFLGEVFFMDFRFLEVCIYWNWYNDLS